MTPSQPPITRTTHTLPFRLSSRDFERLCLGLVEREGYERGEHLGTAGSEQGRTLTEEDIAPKVANRTVKLPMGDIYVPVEAQRELDVQQTWQQLRDLLADRGFDLFTLPPSSIATLPPPSLRR